MDQTHLLTGTSKKYQKVLFCNKLPQFTGTYTAITLKVYGEILPWKSLGTKEDTKYVMNVSQLVNGLRNNVLTQQSHFHTINATTVN